MRMLAGGALVKRVLWGFLCALMLLPALQAAGPRWVTSRPPWNSDGNPMVWYRNDLTYWLDNGPLSASVDNATAQTMVAAAAAVWNIQYSNLTLTQGGTLDEDVSTQNVYLGSSGPIWPMDVDSSNYLNKPIAVLLDRDGTITDLLLGAGASTPTSCRQNAVTESVDLFIQPGQIAHALIILNGRCAGPAPEQMLQMQYQLMRVFGRVIGLGWSQVNDNVFTGAPQPTYQQQLHWPIMHPMDVICGVYTYQCMPNPFTLRDDDRSSVRLLYGTSVYAASDGKFIGGFLNFPNGMGMDGANLVAVRQSTLGVYGTEPWETTSAVSGFLFRGANGNPVTGPLSSFPALQGATNPLYAGYWTMPNVPVIDNIPWDNVYITTQALNPLYQGQYAVGPFTTGPVTPSGSPATLSFYVVGRGSAIGGSLTVPDAASDCSTGNDGTAGAPAPVISGGLWSGRLCGYGHTSWGSVAVQAGRTATLEAMALDENSSATMGKAHLLLGLWHGADPTYILPTIAATPLPFNARQNGTTQTTAAFTATETVRFAITDERGEGRPDFTYAARLLYADMVAPSRMGAGGGAIRIVGMGFQPGNAVTIGGVLATVTGATSTEIDAIAPTLTTLGGNVTNDVTVTDLRTGGATTIAGGLVYAGAATDALALLLAPGAIVDVGVPATLAVRLTDSSGQAVVNTAVTFSVRAGNATYTPCNLSTCIAITDANGMAQTSVTATAGGAVTLQATVASGAAVAASFTANAISQSLTGTRLPEYVAAGSGSVLHPSVLAVLNGSRAGGLPVLWSVLSGNVGLTAAMLHTAADGTSAVTAVSQLTGGQTAQLQACAWNAVCATLPVIGVGLEGLLMQAVSGDAQSISAGTRLGAVALRVVDTQGHGVAGASVQIHQAVTGWQPPCPASGRCAIAPTYGTSTDTAMSDDDGLVAITPLQYAGAATVTRIVAAVGTTGYLALTLTKHP